MKVLAEPVLVFEPEPGLEPVEQVFVQVAAPVLAELFVREQEQVPEPEFLRQEPDLVKEKALTLFYSGHAFRLLLNFCLTCILYFY